MTAVASRTSRENPEWVRDKGDSVRTQVVRVRNIFRAVQLRLTLLASDESGMSTVEYSTVKVYNIGISTAMRPCRTPRISHSSGRISSLPLTKSWRNM